MSRSEPRRTASPHPSSGAGSVGRRLRDGIGHPLVTHRSPDTPRGVASTAPSGASLGHVRVVIVTESFLPALNGVTTSVCKVL